MKKQSSIELIEEKIKFQMKLAQMDKNNGVDWSMSVVIKQLEQLYFDVCEQSKELHKQEIIEAREKAPNLEAKYKGEAEDYYNYTYETNIKK